MEKFTEGWFKKRAIASVKKITDGVFDYSDSLLLYIPGSDNDYEEIQNDQNEYYSLVTKPEHTYLKVITQKLIAYLPNYFRYIDLGPGSEQKEQYFFDAIQNQGKSCIYTPVDISKKFIRKAKQYQQEQGIQVQVLHIPFEEVSDTLKDSEIPHFVSLGLTYSNYFPQEILRLLANIAGEGGYVYVTAQIRDRIDMDALVSTYKKDTLSIVTSKIKLLDLDPVKDVENFEIDNGIRVWCTLRNINTKLANKGMKPGDKLLLFQSIRSSVNEFENEISKARIGDYVLLDTNTTFVGALIKVGGR